MKFIRWSRYTGEPWDTVDLEELVKRLSDFFLQSGFESQYYGISEMDPARSMEQLRQAILRALQEGDLLPQDLMQELLENADLSQNEQLRELLDQLVERLAEQGYISPLTRVQVWARPVTNEALLVVEPGSLAFGDVPVGAPKTLPLTLRSVGQSPVSVSAYALSCPV